MEQIVVTAVTLTLVGLLIYWFNRWQSRQHEDLARLGSDIAARREAQQRKRRS